MIRLVPASLALIFLSTPALADVPGRDWIPQRKVAALLKARGYIMTKIEADDGHWEGEATRRGRKYEFHVNPHSGRITSSNATRTEAITANLTL